MEKTPEKLDLKQQLNFNTIKVVSNKIISLESEACYLKDYLSILITRGDSLAKEQAERCNG